MRYDQAKRRGASADYGPFNWHQALFLLQTGPEYNTEYTFAGIDLPEQYLFRDEIRNGRPMLSWRTIHRMRGFTAADFENPVIYGSLIKLLLELLQVFTYTGIAAAETGNAGSWPRIFETYEVNKDLAEEENARGTSAKGRHQDAALRKDAEWSMRPIWSAALVPEHMLCPAATALQEDEITDMLGTYDTTRPTSKPSQDEKPSPEGPSKQGSAPKGPSKKQSSTSDRPVAQKDTSIDTTHATSGEGPGHKSEQPKKTPTTKFHTDYQVDAYHETRAAAGLSESDQVGLNLTGPFRQISGPIMKAVRETFLKLRKEQGSRCGRANRDWEQQQGFGHGENLRSKECSGGSEV